MAARVVLFAALCALALPAVARGHASFVKSAPANGAVVASAPTSIRFFFTDDVRLGSGIRAIRNGGGSVLAGEPRVVDGRVLVVPLRQRLPDGDYTVLWRVISDDGHTLAGVVAFGIGAGRAPPTPALTVENRPSVTDVIARLLFFGGLLTAVGAAVFRFAVAPVPVRLLLGAFLLVFAGISGMVHGVSLGTRFGTVLAVAAVIAANGALLAAVAPVYQRLERLAFAAAFLLLPAPTLAGHALDAGRPRIEVAVDLLHVAAAAVWVGGLVALALSLRTADRAGVVRRFSNIAVVAALVLATTGVIRAFAELDSFSQLWTTGYGRVLIAKSVLFTVLLPIGWINRYRLIPKLSLAGLRRNVAVEVALFTVTVAAVALLTDLRPGRDRVASAAVGEPAGPPPLPARNMVVQAQQDGELGVALAVRPPGAEVTVLGPDGQGINGLDVTIAGTRARTCGAGCYGAFFAPTSTVRVSVDGRVHLFQVPVEPRPATALVVRATRVFRGLDSVHYIEDLASSPRNRVVAEFILEAPNRLEYEIRGGADGIIIGAQRWDRPRGGDWVASPQQPTSQPEPVWAGAAFNAYLLDATASTYVVSFLNPAGPAWFTVTLDRRTLLPRELSMVAAAHFMKHRYLHFNLPREIRPPTP